jgi:hypothetical protein
MSTAVVNIYHKLPYDFYIGRPRRGIDPRAVPPGAYRFLGNPFPMGKDDREASIAAFAEYFHARVGTDAAFRSAALALQGKTLACFCRPRSCHGDVIAAWLDADANANANTIVNG